MPKLPDYTQFGDAPTPKVQTSIPTYGAPQDIGESIGKGIAAFKEIYKEIEREREKEDILRAEDAYNELKLTENELRAGENGYLSKKGKDAVTQDIVKDYGGKFRQKQMEIGQSLASDRQRELYARRAEVEWIHHQNNLLNHRSKQREEYATSVYKTTLTVEQNDAVVNYNNPNKVESSILRIKAAIDAEGQDKGWSADQIEGQKKISESAIHRSIVDRYLANDNIGGANSYYKQNKARLFDDKDIIHVEARLRSENDSASAQKAGFSAADTSDSLEEARNKLKQKLSGKQLDKAMAYAANEFEVKQSRLAQEDAERVISASANNPTLAREKLKEVDPSRRGKVQAIVEHDITKKETEKKLETEDTFNKALQIVQQTGDPNSIPRGLTNKLSGPQLKYIQDWNTRKPPTEEEEKASSDILKAGRADPNVILNLKPEEFHKTLNGLSATEQKELVDRKEYAQQQLDASRKQLAEQLPGLEHIDRKVRDMALKAGLIKNTGEKMSLEEKIILGDLMRRADKEISNQRDKLPLKGGKLTFEAERQALDKAFASYGEAMRVGKGQTGKDWVRPLIPLEKIDSEHKNDLIKEGKRIMGGELPKKGGIEAAYHFAINNIDNLNAGKISVSEYNNEIRKYLMLGSDYEKKKKEEAIVNAFREQNRKRLEEYNEHMRKRIKEGGIIPP